MMRGPTRLDERPHDSKSFNQPQFREAFSSSGSLAIPAAIFLASSLVMSFAIAEGSTPVGRLAARLPGSDSNRRKPRESYWRRGRCKRCRDIPRLSMVAGSGDGSQSRQEARLGLQPLTDYAGTSFTIGRPSLRKDVIDDVIRFDAERVLNDLGGLFAVVTIDGSFQHVTHLRTRHNRHQAPKIGPASRHDHLRFLWRMFILWRMSDFGTLKAVPLLPSA